MNNNCTFGLDFKRFIIASINILKEGLKTYDKKLAITKVEEKSDLVTKYILGNVKHITSALTWVRSSHTEILK